MSTKLTIFIAIAILGGLLMFGILHYRGVAAKQQAQAQCMKGDQKADQAAAEAQHQADMQTLNDTLEQLKHAQAEQAKAQRLADSATARANRLQDTIDVLRRTDPAVRSWYDEALPAGVLQQLGK